MSGVFSGLVRCAILGSAVLVAGMGLSAGTVAAQERYMMIGGSSSDPYWSVVRRGAIEAGKDLNVTVDYLPQDEDYVASTVRLLQTVLAQKPNGLATPVPDIDALRDSLATAVASGIHLVVTSSAETIDGALVSLGQDEQVAGERAGAAAKQMGEIKKVLCVNHFISVIESTRRCNGFATGSGAQLVEIDSGSDPNTVVQRVQGALAADPEIDSILALGLVSAIPTVDVIERLGLQGKVKFFTFDMSAEILDGIDAGNITFAIDSQPFLQGYMAIAILHAKSKFGVAPVGQISSGPAMVTKANLAEFRQGVSDGIR